MASGGRVGFTGNRSVFDTPFTQNNYTEKLIRDQGAQTIADVLANDPSVRPAAPPFGASDFMRIRGFNYNPYDFAFDGLYGLASRRRPLLEAVERVEVLHGPAAFLFGFPPIGSIGGVVNLVPKRAGDVPLTRITAEYLSKASGGTSFDIGRRYGDGNVVGVRVNGAYRDGEVPIDRLTQQLGALAVGLDYRGDRMRLSLDLAYEHSDYRAPSSSIGILSGFRVPRAPNLSRNIQQSSEFARYEHIFGVVRGEYDLTPDLTLYGAVGGSRLDDSFLSFSPTITNAAGRLNMVSYQQASPHYIRETAEAGIRGRLDTGPITHRWTIGGSYIAESDSGPLGTTGVTYVSNLYAPLPLPRPTTARPASRVYNVSLAGIAVADTMSVLDDHIQLTVGGRAQRAERTSYSSATGPTASSSYDQSALTPLAALVVKPWEPLSLYASYAEGFGYGPAAPGNARNNTQVFPPIISTQIETGAKLDLGTVGLMAAFYEIKQPSGFLDPATLVFGINGEQRNRGMDFNVFGSPIEGVRVLGGVTLLDGILTKTVNGTNNGKVAPGVPEVQLNLGGEVDLPPWLVPGLTVSGRVIYTSAQYVDLANTQKIPDWTRLDLGARYSFLADGRFWTARFNVENVVGTNYWATALPSSLVLGTPRTFRLSLSVDL